MNLKWLLGLLFTGLALGIAVVWFLPWFQGENQTRSLSLLEGEDSIFSQTKRVLSGDSADGGATTPLDSRQVDWSQLADPFLTPPCFWGGQNPCLVTFARLDDQHFVFHLDTLRNIAITKEVYVVGLSRIVAKPDNIRQHFVTNQQPTEYVNFVRQVEDLSIENQLNPEIVYTSLDYLMGKQVELGKPTTLPSISEYVLSLNNYHLDTESIAQRDATLKTLPKGISAEGRTLLYVASVFYPDAQILQKAFNEQGSFEAYYQERARGVYIEAPFSFQIPGQTYEEEDYFDHRLQTAFAVCVDGQAHLCSDFQVDQQGNPWEIICRGSVFLDDLCDGTLPNLTP